MLYVDGSVGQEHKEAGFLLQNPIWIEFSYALIYTFSISNNEYEYEVLLARLRMTTAMNIEQLIIRGDSKIVSDMLWSPLKPKKRT